MEPVAAEGLTVDEIAGRIGDKEEILKLALYREIRGREPIAEIDEALLRYYAAE